MEVKNSVNTTTSGDEEQSLAEVIYKYLAYWPVFALLVLVFLTGAWLYLRYTLPVYESSASLLIKDNKGTPGGDLGPLEAFDLFGTANSVENEAAILKSKTLMQKVVRNLYLYAPVFVKGRILDQPAYELSPVRLEMKYPDSIRVLKPGQELEQIPFTFNESNQTVQIDKHAYPLNQFISTKYGIVRFVENRNYEPPRNGDSRENNTLTTFYFQLNNVEEMSNYLLTRLDVSTDKISKVIRLNIKNEVPKRGEDILDELLKMYNEAAILDKNMLAGNTLKFVEDRLQYVSHELDSVEAGLQRFKSQNQITDITAQGQIYLQTVAANDQTLSEIDMQLAALDQVEKYVKTGGGVGGVVSISSMSLPNAAFTTNLTRLSELELQYTQLKKTVPENNPQLQSLLDGINKLKPTILENVINQRKNLLASRTDLASVNNSYNSLLKSVPEKERELLSISRQQAIKNNIYTFLLQKREETALSYASAVPDSRIIDPGQSEFKPVSPKKSLIYLAALILALGIGFAIFYIKDLLTFTIQSRTEIERISKIPILGEVVYDISKNPLVIAEGKRSFIAEQFRQLRTALNYIGIDNDQKTILLTSSISGEGKSFIAVNLAISLSLMGKRVVLLEADLRKPKISDLLTISRTDGISNYLIGKKNLPEIIKNTGIENLSLIPSGPIPPNPSELLAGVRMKELLAALEAEYDYVIVDTAPVGPVTDAFILSPLCDATLFIIRHDYSPKALVRRLENFRENDAFKNPVIIYNGVKQKGLRGYGYGAYGKYGYGYGYGYTDEGPKLPWWKRIF